MDGRKEGIPGKGTRPIATYSPKPLGRGGGGGEVEGPPERVSGTRLESTDPNQAGRLATRQANESGSKLFEEVVYRRRIQAPGDLFTNPSSLGFSSSDPVRFHLQGETGFWSLFLSCFVDGACASSPCCFRFSDVSSFLTHLSSFLFVVRGIWR